MKLRFWKSDDYDTPPPYFLTDETNNRSSRAWVLALATFLATLLVLSLLYFSGRWVYRRFTNNDKNLNTTSEIKNDSTESTTSTVTTAESTPTPTATPTPTPTPTTSSNSTSSSSATNSTLTNTGGSDTLPRTGIDSEE